jgi:hypothetical protein
MELSVSIVLKPRCRSVATAFFVLLMAAAPALAQAPRSAQPSRAPAAKSAPARTGECGQLPGGKAPVQKIAALTTGLSPRDLDLVYFNKPLADLTAEDFQQIAELSKRCGAGEGILPPDQLQSLETVIRTAQKTRHTVLDGLKKQMTEITALPLARDKLVRLNELADRMPALETALPRGDIKMTVGWIARQSQALYDAAPKAAVAAVNGPAPPSVKVDAPAPAVGNPRRPGGEEH